MLFIWRSPKLGMVLSFELQPGPASCIQRDIYRQLGWFSCNWALCGRMDLSRLPGRTWLGRQFLAGSWFPRRMYGMGAGLHAQLELLDVVQPTTLALLVSCWRYLQLSLPAEAY